MGVDRRTKAQLLAALKRAEAERAEAEETANRAIDKLPPAPVVVAEADALASCIRAIDKMLETPRRGGTSGFSYESIGLGYGRLPDIMRPQSDVERLLRSLAAKYEVPLVEVREQPCSRRHLDEVDPRQVLDALGGPR